MNSRRTARRRCVSSSRSATALRPNSPVQVHWAYADPSNAPDGDEGKRHAFELTREAIGYRMLKLLALPLECLDDAELQQALNDILQS